MKIFISNANSYLGRVLCEELLKTRQGKRNKICCTLLPSKSLEELNTPQRSFRYLRLKASNLPDKDTFVDFESDIYDGLVSNSESDGHEHTDNLGSSQSINYNEEVLDEEKARDEDAGGKSTAVEWISRTTDGDGESHGKAPDMKARYYNEHTSFESRDNMPRPKDKDYLGAVTLDSQDSKDADTLPYRILPDETENDISAPTNKGNQGNVKNLIYEGAAHTKLKNNESLIWKIIDANNLQDLAACVTSCSVVIYDLHTANFSEIESVIRILKYAESATKKITFILISSVMVWARNSVSKATNQKFYNQGLKSSDYNERLPYPAYEPWKYMETLALLLNKTRNVRTYVLAAGLLYGCGEKIFFDIFNEAFHQKRDPGFIIGEGSNLLPTVHVRDLSRVVKTLMLKQDNWKPNLQQYYHLVVDHSSFTQKEIIGEIYKKIQPNKAIRLESIDFPSSLSIRNCEFLSLDLLMLPTKIMQDEYFKWYCKNGMVANMEILIEEFIHYRMIQATRILVTGPPGAGKTYLAKHLSKKYKIPHINASQMMEFIRRELASNRDILRLLKRTENLQEAVNEPDNSIRSDMPDEDKFDISASFERMEFDGDTESNKEVEKANSSEYLRKFLIIGEVEDDEELQFSKGIHNAKEELQTYQKNPPANATELKYEVDLQQKVIEEALPSPSPKAEDSKQQNEDEKELKGTNLTSSASWPNNFASSLTEKEEQQRVNHSSSNQGEKSSQETLQLNQILQEQAFETRIAVLLLQDMIMSNTSLAACRLQGFVLDGFPENYKDAELFFCRNSPKESEQQEDVASLLTDYLIKKQRDKVTETQKEEAREDELMCDDKSNSAYPKATVTALSGKGYENVDSCIEEDVRSTKNAVLSQENNKKPKGHWKKYKNEETLEKHASEEAESIKMFEDYGDHHLISRKATIESDNTKFFDKAHPLFFKEEANKAESGDQDSNKKKSFRDLINSCITHLQLRNQSFSKYFFPNCVIEIRSSKKRCEENIKAIKDSGKITDGYDDEESFLLRKTRFDSKKNILEEEDASSFFEEFQVDTLQLRLGNKREEYSEFDQLKPPHFWKAEIFIENMRLAEDVRLEKFSRYNFVYDKEKTLLAARRKRLNRSYELAISQEVKASLVYKKYMKNEKEKRQGAEELLRKIEENDSLSKQEGTRQYLMSTVIPILSKGLTHLFKAAPADPIDFLADYLLANAEEDEEGGNVK